MNIVWYAQRKGKQLLRSARNGLVALGASIIAANGALAATGTAVEYFHAELGHYFVTAFPDEVAILDAGTTIKGWARTGYAFSVAGDASGGDFPVCRFFSATFGLKSSHFYTPYGAECTLLKAGSTWTYEGTAFHLKLPSAAGTCDADASLIYRLYNNGAGGAPNHRYTAERAVFDAMRGLGWTPEGDGVTGVFACGPPAPKGGSAFVALLDTRLGLPYDISIAVPAGYHPNSDPVPVIYALDGQSSFQPYLDIMRETGAKAILVAIHDMDRRQVDYNVPGANDYLPFLTKVVIPYIEANYRADPRRRVLNGYSTGGNFPFHALYLEAPSRWSFAHYWSTDGAFWQQPEAVSLEESEMFAAVGRLPFPVTFVMARGAPGLSNSIVVGALYDKIAGRNYVGLRLIDLQYPLNHGEIPLPAFRDYLKILFGQ